MIREVKSRQKKYLRDAAEAQTMFLKLNKAEVQKKVTEKLRKNITNAK